MANIRDIASFYSSTFFTKRMRSDITFFAVPIPDPNSNLTSVTRPFDKTLAKSSRAQKIPKYFLHQFDFFILPDNRKSGNFSAYCDSDCDCSVFASF